MAHLSVKQRDPFRKSLSPSRRHSRHTASLYLAKPGPPAYTRRRFGGRHPSWGIGVTSRMAVISSPTAGSERMAASRPAPGPFTKTSTCFRPSSMAFRAAASAAIWAANGVDLREPLNPTLPALAHATTPPIRSAKVTMVLLNVAWTWAMPVRTSRRSFRLVPALRGLPVGCSAILYALPVAGFLPVVFLRFPPPRRGPLRVRALVWVRWPRTGSPLRCRTPRYELMSISRLMFMDTSRRRSPSTLHSRSSTSRTRTVSSSVQSFTGGGGARAAWVMTRRDEGGPIP